MVISSNRLKAVKTVGSNVQFSVSPHVKISIVPRRRNCMSRTPLTTRPYSLLLCALLGLSMFAADAARIFHQSANAQQQDDKKEEKKEELILKPEGKVSFTTD